MEEFSLGEWIVRTTGSDQQPVSDRTVPAANVAFSWLRVGRDTWMEAVRLAPLRVAAREVNWLGIGSLEPKNEITTISP